MGTGVALIAVGLLAYLGSSVLGVTFFGLSRRGGFGYMSQPRTGVVPVFFSLIALLGGAVAILGAILIFANP